MNFTDLVLKKIINALFTTDEWHTIVLGFFDGLSFEQQGRWTRKALARPGINFENISNEKSWYYRVPYTLGELVKVGIAAALYKWVY